MKICIAGGGLAGLALAHFLRGDVDFVICEKDVRAGGLLKSETVEGFTFDTGGSHILFSKNGRILREMVNLVGDVVMHRRRTYIHYHGRFIKYPFENGIFMLPPQERFEILKDFVENLARDKRKPENLRDFFVQMFGEKMVEKYLGPYNEKIWKRKLEDIAMAWEEDRLPKPPVEDVLRAAVGLETEGYTHQLRFFYPLHGGIESLAIALAEEVNENLRLSEEISQVMPSSDGISVNGEMYDYMVSTIPLPVMARIAGGELANLAEELDYNSVTVVGLGVKGKIPDFHWLYVPDKDIAFHRLAFLSNYSPNMAPPGMGTIIAEISHRPNERVENPEERVIEGLEKLGIDVEVIVAKHWVNHYAYVVTDHRYFEIIPRIRKKLEEMRIYTLGRHGNWEYLNMDAVWKRAMAMAERIRGLA